MNVSIAIASALLTASTPAPSTHAPPPIVDGDCAEYAVLGARTVPMAEGVVLRIHKDRDFIWLCYDYPPGSDGTLDLQIDSPSLPEPLNLHVSASIGEWPLARSELAPQTADSTSWWNNRDWIANPVLIESAKIVDGRLRYSFRNAGARELQLRTQRFGSEGLRLKFHIRRIRAPDGKFREFHFPADGSWFRL